MFTSITLLRSSAAAKLAQRGVHAFEQLLVARIRDGDGGLEAVLHRHQALGEARWRTCAPWTSPPRRGGARSRPRPLARRKASDTSACRACSSASWACRSGPGGRPGRRRPGVGEGEAWSLFDMTVRNELSRRPWGGRHDFKRGVRGKMPGAGTHSHSQVKWRRKGGCLTMRTPRTEAAFSFTSAITSAA